MSKYVYLVSDKKFMKIGVTRKPIVRLETIQSYNRRKITLEYLTPCIDRKCALFVESQVLETFSADLTHQGYEWFVCNTPVQEVINLIKALRDSYIPK